MSDLIRPNRPGAPAPSQQPQNGFPHEPIQQPVDLRWLWLVIVKHKILIVLLTICTIAPTVLYIRYAQRLYRATVTIQVDPESAKVLPYKDVSDSSSNPLPHFELYMKTQDELLRSATLATRVSRWLRRDPKLSLAGLENDLRHGLQVQRVEGSQMLRISYVAPDPELAAIIANTWAAEFIKMHVETRYQTSEKATDFLQGQLKSLKEKVEKAEADLIEYASSHDILNIDNKQENVIRQRFGYLNGEVSRAEKDFIAKRAEYDGLKDVSVDDFPESLKSPVIASLETRAFQTEQELSKLLSQFDERWPGVIQKKQELALVNRQLSEAKAAALAKARKQAEIQYGTAKGEYVMLQKAFRQQAGLVNRLNQASVEYNTLKRDLEASEQLYQGLLQRLKETGVGSGLELGNIHIADRARPEHTPYRPRTVLSISLAIILGLTLGVGISFVVESLNNTLSDPWDVEKLGLPLLGWIPIATNGSRRDQRLLDSGGRPEGTASTGLVASAGPNGHNLTKAQYRVRECYRALCASILLSRAENPPKTVLITSAVPKEGKTTTTASLGVTLAEMGSPTLIIDADFRNPCLAKKFNIRASEGLSTFLAGGRLVIEETATPNLFLLASGPAPPNPVGLFSAERMGEVLDQLGNRFRFILIDSPPVLSVADANVLATKVNGVILVIHAGQTPQEIIRKAVIQLNRSGSCVLGAAVNQVDLTNPEYSYYHKYYYGDKYVVPPKS